MPERRRLPERAAPANERARRERPKRRLGRAALGRPRKGGQVYARAEPNHGHRGGSGGARGAGSLPNAYRRAAAALGGMREARRTGGADRGQRIGGAPRVGRRTCSTARFAVSFGYIERTPGEARDEAARARDACQRASAASAAVATARDGRRVSGQSRGRCGALRSYPRPPRRLRRRPKVATRGPRRLFRAAAPLGGTRAARRWRAGGG